MRIKQRFFPAPGTTPHAYGYGRVSHKRQFDKGNSLEDQEARVKAYYQLRLLDDQSIMFGTEWGGMYNEPRAQSAFSRPFSRRPAGGELWHTILKPGDHLVIDKLDRLFRDLEDFCITTRYFTERGISIHFVNFLGLSLDTRSIGGEFMLKMFAVFAEMESMRISERVVAARRAKREAGKHQGTRIPFFLEVTGCGGGRKVGGDGKLIFKPWAIPMMQRIKELKDRGYNFREIGEEGVLGELAVLGFRESGQANPRKRDRIRYLYWFHEAWLDAGQPDPTTLQIVPFVNDHVRKIKEENRE